MGSETGMGDLRVDFSDELRDGAKIKVIGVGGGGGNAINRMIAADLKGVDFLVANTDAQALQASNAPLKIQLGTKLTKGLGSGGNPEVGRRAALEDTEKIIEALEGADMVFVTTGLGRRDGDGGRPHRCQPGARNGRADRGRGNQALRLRRQAPHDAGGAGFGGIESGRGHRHLHSQ